MEPSPYVIGDFELKDEERSGGMSRVRKAKLTKGNTLCALKFARLEGDKTLANASLNRELGALSNLEHPNIVRLFGIGTDGSDRFLVIEWLDETLKDRIAALGPMGWRDFYEQIGRPLLHAIEYAHRRGYIHRDLKPLNVMFDRMNAPKITDFGIARALAEVRIGATFARVGSAPWTPSEADNGVHSEARDLYSWAAICIACLTGRQDFVQVSELRKAASALEAVAPIAIIAQCLSDLPHERPQLSTQLMWDLDDFHSTRAHLADGPRQIGVELSNLSHRKLAELLPGEGGIDARLERLFADFSKPCEVELLPDGDLDFSGQTFCFRAGLGIGESPWLLVKDLRAASQSPPAGVSIRMSLRLVDRASTAGSLNELRANVRFLQSFLQTRKQRSEEEQQRRDEERYLNLLQDVVAAHMRELREIPALRYIEGKWEGGEFTIKIDDYGRPSLGEQRVIRSSGAILVFEVARVSQDRVWLRPIGQRRMQVPPDGQLQVDTAAQRRALERQEDALKTLRNDQAVLASLKRLILNPKAVDAPEQSGRAPVPGLSADKVSVLDSALGMRQMLVVRGPPGTGKTTLIAEVVKQFLKERPQGRVLLAAQTHIAIDHVLSKLLQLDELADRVVRVARSDEEKLADQVREALLQRRVASWCQTTAEKSRRFMREQGIAKGLNANEVELSIRLEALVLAIERLNALAARLNAETQALETAESSPRSTEEFIQVETATIAAMTVKELTQEQERADARVSRLRTEIRQLGRDGAALADLGPNDIRVWLEVLEGDSAVWKAFRHDVSVQVAWLDSLGQLKRFEEIVLRTASVVAGTCVGLGSSDAFMNARFDLCIIDEASKATASEALIPMVRSERCMLVGDPKQLPPFDYGPLDVEGYSQAEVKETLLDYLIPRLPKECVHGLTHQHRMCKTIGAMIGHVFYGDVLTNVRDDDERPEWIRRKFPKAVVWIDTNGAPQQRRGYTYVNLREQDLVLDTLKTLHIAARKRSQQASVAVIAGYAAQAHALDAKIQRSSFPTLSIEVATVDSFQGKESDICIFSVTLSNSSDFLGFLRSIQRLNVALSRPRDLLVIVGDQQFCYEVPGANPFIAVIDYIEANLDKCEMRDARS
jgi:serine/threonine protein kinase/KaiC/GvpD/RAD55 family RecA-like ATPase